jgi:hypothetical protein
LPPGALSVQISTDGGSDFCDVNSGVPITDFLHVSGVQQLCLFPTVSLKFAVRWRSNAVLTSLSITFLPKHPNELPKPPVQVLPVVCENAYIYKPYDRCVALNVLVANKPSNSVRQP